MPPAETSEAQRFAARLRSLMAERRLSRNALATAVSVDPATVSQWRGGAYMPNNDKWQAIASALGVAVVELFDSTPERRSLTRVVSGPADEERDRVRRRWLARFRADLIELYATDAEVAAAEGLVQAPEVLRFLRSYHPGATAFDAMQWLGGLLVQDVARRHGRPRSEADAAMATLAELLRKEGADTDIVQLLPSLSGQLVRDEKPRRAATAKKKKRRR